MSISLIASDLEEMREFLSDVSPDDFADPPR